MIFNQITFDNKVHLHNLGVIEDIKYTNLSSNLIFKDIALRPSHFQRRVRDLKEINIALRVIDKNLRAETKRKVDEIVGASYSEKPFLYAENNTKFCDVVLSSADSEYLFTKGLLMLTFINLDGLWYGEEKIATTSITNNGVIATSKATLSITPSQTAVTIKDGKGGIISITALNTTSIITVDLYNKTVSQNGKYIPLSLTSRFFNFDKGVTTLTITGGTVNTVYREVIALWFIYLIEMKSK